VELQGLIPDHSLQALFGWLEVVPAPVKWFIAFRLDLFVVQSFKVWVLQALLHYVPLFWVEYQHFTQEIQGNRVCLWIEASPTLFISFGQLSNVFTSQIVSNECHVFVGWSTKHSNCSFDLVKVIITREERCSSKKLGKNASNRPNIEGVGVMRSIKDNFWSTIPSSDDILSQCGGSLFVTTCEPKITNL
jgi:hypothetical protein